MDGAVDNSGIKQKIDYSVCDWKWNSKLFVHIDKKLIPQ